MGEAAQHACRYRPYRDLYLRTKARLGRNRGAKVAAICVARRLAEALLDAHPQPAVCPGRRHVRSGRMTVPG